MGINWIDTSKVHINALLLLERVQIRWLFDYVPAKEIAPIINEYPYIEWYFRNKCSDVQDKIDTMKAIETDRSVPIRMHEENLLSYLVDWLVYVLDPKLYDAQSFTTWDSEELLMLDDFKDKVIVDVGAGTGRLAFAVSQKTKATYCVEPVENLRRYIRSKAESKRLENVYCVDGLITEIPFDDEFADAVLAGHVFGDDCDKEYNELCRITKPHGLIVLCPGNNDADNDVHKYLVGKGFEWSVFEEPGDGKKRKYWKRKSA